VVKNNGKEAGMLVLGCDVSKGYADIAVLTETGKQIFPTKRYDDSHEGELLLNAMLGELHQRFPGEPLVAAMESTGGYEANLVRFFRNTKIQARVFNPQKIKSFRRIQLHRAQTDAKAAEDIALYVVKNPQDTGSRELTPKERAIKKLARMTDKLTRQCAAAENALTSTLFTIFPEIIPIVRADFPQWLLVVLKRYPVPEKLRRARVSSLTRIPYVTQEKAMHLLELARHSRGADNDDTFALLVKIQVNHLLLLSEQRKMWQKALEKQFQEMYPENILSTIPGVSEHGAAGIMAMTGDFHHYASSSRLVAFVGLDPRPNDSGDVVRHRSITKRGPSLVRALLFMECLTMLKMPGHPIRRFYDRLIGQGRPFYYVMTACMRKLLRIMYAVEMSGRPFDMDYEDKVKAREQSERDRNRSNRRFRASASLSLTAPVSTREAKRRKLARAEAQKGSGEDLNGLQALSQGRALRPKKKKEVLPHVIK